MEEAAAKIEGLSGPHRFYDWSGSPFEIGFQHGKALAPKIAAEGSAIERMAQSCGLDRDAMLDRVLSHYEPLFRRYLPRAVEEIEGIAAGSGLGYPFAFYAATRDGMKAPCAEVSTACTSFAASGKATQDGHALLGQNKDTGVSTERYHIMRIACDSGQRRIILNYAGWIGNMCLTSDGMAMAGNSLYGQAPTGETIPYSFLKRLVQETKSVREFLDVLNSIEDARFENGCFLVGDASGHTVCIECVAGHTSIRDVSRKAFGHANSILTPELQHYEDEVLGSPSSPQRQKHIDKLLAAKNGSLTTTDLQRIASDHTGYPYSLCRHTGEEDPLATSASFIADLTAGTADISIGNPCTAGYITYHLKA